MQNAKRNMNGGLEPVFKDLFSNRSLICSYFNQVNPIRLIADVYRRRAVMID